LDSISIPGVIITPLKNIEVPGGNVLHAIKRSDIGFQGFGEAYFSSIGFMSIKAWKKHKKMTLNLVVPIGKIKFVMYDDRHEDKNKHVFSSVILSMKNYSRLTVPPNLWLGFIGLDKKLSYLLNVADIEHDTREVIKVPINKFNYKWKD
jgi:dTDP-4-dehydrorhamnose 3,5-epimerase